MEGKEGRGLGDNLQARWDGGEPSTELPNIGGRPVSGKGMVALPLDMLMLRYCLDIEVLEVEVSKIMG